MNDHARTLKEHADGMKLRLDRLRGQIPEDVWHELHAVRIMFSNLVPLCESLTPESSTTPSSRCSR